MQSDQNSIQQKGILRSPCQEGRSNVGNHRRSNTLINRKSTPGHLDQPGKTQTLNFYKIEDRLYFVDVPGYGYAKVSKKIPEKWGKMIETYF